MASLPSVQHFITVLVSRGVVVEILSTRPRDCGSDLAEVAERLGVHCYCMGDLIEQGLYETKADLIAHRRMFNDEEYLLIDNDPNEIISALKHKILAFCVPGYLTEDLFGDMFE